jgi:beta-galactosidase
MLGVCYYPEHWSPAIWQQDAKEMRELGLKYVRIAEFAWSRIEPQDGVFDFLWLDQAIETLAGEGLSVIMCTPTATPPKWLIDKFPDILAVDVKTGLTRGFGSRRHYDFSSKVYLQESLRISEILAKRYGSHPAIVGWQTDNELACHDTTSSASVAAKTAFQHWCKQRYGDITKLNAAWGNVFWSMEFPSFESIEVPYFAVTETNPSHQLAFRRFSSDQVVHFHNEMVSLLRKYCGERFITHNFIPMADTQTDNYALAAPLDFASFDNYPLGRTDLFFADKSPEAFKPYMRTGHPDFSSYYFDQTRGLCGKNFWIMEQQPGPVNWATHNPRPEPGMIALWSWVAFAHGADTLCYFRWRQAGFAQEQMHAGLKRIDNSPSAAWPEVQQVKAQLDALKLGLGDKVPARIAMVTTTENQWVTEIEQQGQSYKHQQVEFEYYSALRQLGLDIDFISPQHSLAAYELVVVPTLTIIDDAFIEKCKQSAAVLVFGPRSGSKTDEFHLAPNLGPGKLQSLLPVNVLSVETIRGDIDEDLFYNDKVYRSNRWREELLPQNGCEVVASYHDASPAIVKQANVYYIGTLSCNNLLVNMFNDIATEQGIETYLLPQDVRMAKRGEYGFVFNYSAKNVSLDALADKAFVLGGVELPAYQYAVFKR